MAGMSNMVLVTGSVDSFNRKDVWIQHGKTPWLLVIPRNVVEASLKVQTRNKKVVHNLAEKQKVYFFIPESKIRFAKERDTF